MGKLFLTISIVALVSTIVAVAPASAQTAPPPSKVINRVSVPVKGQYIVVFKNTVRDVRSEVGNLNRNRQMKVKYIYDVALKGFAAEIPETALRALRNNPKVDYIEQDQTVSINGITSQTPTPSWGLDRIDQTNSTADNTYKYAYDGTGVTAYIIDTGIRSTHVQFRTGTTTRVMAGYSAIGGGTKDCNGHGTHVAGTVGGNTVGVAKKIALVPVRVLNCQGSGTTSGVIAGVNWVASNAAGKRAVANMSLGGGVSLSIDDAVRGAIAKGVIMAVAAGNSNVDASSSSPARVPEAITVGATALGDTKATYSNYGALVDIFAPGTNIYSAWSSSDTSYATISGTSMATPHVAGAVGLLLQEKSLTPGSGVPGTIREQLIADSEKDLVLNTTGNPNNFLNTNYTRPTTP